MAIPLSVLADNPDYVSYLIETLKYTHARLKVLATSPLSCLPRCTFINLGEWIVSTDPQSRFDDAASVVTLGVEGQSFKGKISPLAAAIHPFDNFKKSSFSVIHIEKIDHAPRSQAIGPARSIVGWLSLALEVWSLLSWMKGDLYPTISGFNSNTDVIHLVVCMVFSPINALLAFAICNFFKECLEGWLAGRYENAQHSSSTDKAHDNPHTELTWSMRTMVHLCFLVWVGAISYSIMVKEFEATMFLSVLGAYNSIVTYLTRWRQIRIEAESATSNKLRKRKKGDVMIYTEQGALILVKCSPRVAEELYFNFPTYESKSVVPDDASTTATALFVILGLGGAVLFVYEFVRVIWLRSTSVTGSRIILYSSFVNCALEILFGYIPSYFQWDLGRYYWADISPRKKETAKLSKDGDESVEEDVDPFANIRLLAGLDNDLIRSVKWALDMSLDIKWVRGLNVAAKSGRPKEVGVALMLAGLHQSKTLPIGQFFFKKGLMAKLRGKEDLLTEAMAYQMLGFSFAMESLGKGVKKKHKEPDPSTFHVNSVSRELGYSFWPVNLVKMFVEFCVGRPLSWYPFREPEDWPPARLVRVYAMHPEHPDRIRFHYDMPAKLADRLFSYPFQAYMIANDSDAAMFQMPSVFLHGTSIVKILLDLQTSIEEANAKADPPNPAEAGLVHDVEEQQSESSKAPQTDLPRENANPDYENKTFEGDCSISEVTQVSPKQDAGEQPQSFDELDTKSRGQDIAPQPEHRISETEVKTKNTSEAVAAQISEQEQLESLEMSDPSIRVRDAVPSHENGTTSETEASTTNGAEASSSQSSQQQSSSPDASIPLENIVPNPRGGVSETEAQAANVPPVQPDDRDRDILFICADIATHESRARAIKLGKNDRGTIDQLRSTYRSLHARLPRIKRITGIKFFRFHSFLQREMDEHKQLLVHIHKDMQRYPVESDPEYNEYRYFPRPWPAQLPFPDREICWYFLHPEDCGTSSSLNQMLPARVGDDLVTHRRAFGIYIEELYSLWAIFVPVVVLSSMMLVATLWFIREHTDDLQTAIVPFTVASSIGTLVINVAVSLLLFRMLAP